MLVQYHPTPQEQPMSDMNVMTHFKAHLKPRLEAMLRSPGNSDPAVTERQAEDIRFNCWAGVRYGITDIFTVLREYPEQKDIISKQAKEIRDLKAAVAGANHDIEQLRRNA